MTTPTQQQLDDATTDLSNIADVGNADESTTVVMRLGRSVRSVAKAIADVYSAGLAGFGDLFAARDTAIASATSAQIASAAAQALGTYPSTAAGITGTTSGKYFFVKQAGPLLELYLNSSGTAVDQNFSFSGSIFTMPIESGYSWGVADTSGRAALLIALDGTVVPIKISLPASCVTRASLTSDVLSSMLAAGLGSMFQTAPPESGFIFTIVDALGQMIFGIPIAGGPITAYATRALSADNAIAKAGARPRNGYMPYNVVDGSGKQQIHCTRLSDSKKFVLTTTGNNVDPWVDDRTPKNVLFSSDFSGAFLDYFIPAEGGAINKVFPDSDIYCFGTSLSFGANLTSGQPYPQQLAIALGRVTYNRGGSGQNSQEIIARQGGNPTQLTVTANQIPATVSALVVTAYTADIFSLSGVHAAGSATGTLAGIPGTLASDVSGNYTFTRTTAGSIVACSAGTPFILDDAVVARQKIQLIENGRNSLGQQSQIMSDAAAGVAYLSPYTKRFAFLAILNGTGEFGSNANYIALKADNAAYLAAYPDNFIDTQAPPTTAEMAALSYTPSSQDLIDIANDCIPTGMRNAGDPLHLNSIGYALWVLRIVVFFIAKGW